MKIRRSSGRARASSPLLILFLVALVWPNGHGRSGAISSDPRATVPPEKPKETARADDRLSPDDFAAPPLQARPGCFWDWLNGTITRDQITRDLEAMKRAGMRGGEIWDVAAYADPDGRVPAGPAFLGPESARLIAHAIREADRLGLEIGLVASSGWNAGGSWIRPEHAGKGLYQSLTRVAGPRVFHEELPLPELPKLCPRDERGRPVYLYEVAVLAVPADDKKTIADASRILDLTDKVAADGKLRWDVPAGDWSILRFVCANHGQQLIVPSPNSGGPMIDFFDPAATEFHLRHILTTILKELGRTTFEGTSFKTIEFDSMELDGFTPWTGSMAAEFERLAGYSAIRFLPLLAGWSLADPETQERFLYDWRKTVSDRLIESHYATGRTFLASFGVSLIAEAGGPGPPIWDSNPVDGIKALGAVDIPRGEFWIRHRGIFLVKEIASAAHVYDKRLVDAESFTTWRRWVDGPLSHKEIADRALGEGLNCFSLHTFASSPPEAGLPGWAYHAGTDINPSATWWPMASGLMDYLARCSYLLRQGWFVADVCYYYGDQAPNFYPPLCNVPQKPKLDGLDPRNDFDVCSSEVILKRMRVDKGRIVLPDGTSYAALVLPEQDHIPSEVLAKVRALLADGGTVIGRQRPARVPGLRDREKKTRETDRLADELWGRKESPDEGDTPGVSIRPVGRGRFVIAADRSRALREIGVAPDFEISGRREGDLGPLDFIHRKTRDDEFYFVRNTTREPQALTCRFRVAAEANGQVPEFWWPDSGRRSACRDWNTAADGRTEVRLELGALGSVFVVFRKAKASDRPALDPLARDTFRAADAPALLPLEGPWDLEFPEGWGAPRTATFAKLQSWTDSDDEGIRFFSGIAVYRKTFELPEALAKRDRLFLELGDLAEIAEVTLNGRRLGLVWLPPYRIEISGAVRPGRNQVEIRVANLWANRLNADSLRPEADRFTRSNIDRIQTDPTSDSSYGRVPRGKTRPVYREIPPLMRSGLFGPVRVITPSDSSFRMVAPDDAPAPGANEAAVRVDIDWAAFLADHDLVWTRLPEKYGERPFLGNGQLGSMLYAAGDEIRVPLGRTDIQDHRDDSAGWAAYSRPRFLLGEMALKPVGRIRSGRLRLDLWNAELRAEIVTDKGTIDLTQFVPTAEMGVVTVLRPSPGEAGCRWTWLPGEARTTRPGVPETRADIEAYAKRYGPQHASTLKLYIPNPAVRREDAGPVAISVQDLLAGGSYAVAWRDVPGSDGTRILYIGSGNSFPDRTAAADAAAVVTRLAGRRLDDAAAAHRAWWHAYYPSSFITLPDARWESFYWIQMYKLACATRSGRTMMDTSGPWNVATPWPYITWDLNVQLCYWPVVASNRIELGRSLTETLTRNRQALIDNVRPPEWRSDSAVLPIATAQDLIGPRDGDMRYFQCVGDLPWALHNAWLMYRATMDDRLLRDDIVPLLRRSVNLYLHLLEEGPDGRLHLPETYSPEYGTAPDCNFDLALLRWACGALLAADRRLVLGDPLVPKWKDVLARLAPYPEDPSQGFLIGRDVPLARGHRHYSHLLMIYPLYLVNADQPGAAGRIEASVRHWADRPEERMGYTFTGASSIMAALGRGADALTYLQGLNPFLEPNTLYIEASPTLETPLSAAQCLHDMLLQSWAGPSEPPAPDAGSPVIRVFPAVPPSWSDVRFHDLRADGAFLISAERSRGRTRWVRIKSLAGEPCRIRPGLEGEIAVLAARTVALKPLEAGTYELGLKKGEEAVLYSGPGAPAIRIAPLPRSPKDRNPFGLRAERESE